MDLEEHHATGVEHEERGDQPLGASVRSVIHSGIRSSTVLRSVTAAYGRSRRTSDFAPRTAGTGATAGSRSRTSAQSRKLGASIAKTARYAGPVPADSASPPSAAPTARPALSADWRWASAPVRSSLDIRPASSACRAAARPDCAVA